MNVERVLALYERVADTPDAIARLRRFVLDLAVRGKLVEQDPNDESASELLKRIGKERAARIYRGELRKVKGMAAPSADAQLFQLPAKWAWSVADQLWDFENGDRSSNYPSRDQLVPAGIPFVNAGHLVGGRVSLADMNYITSAKFASLGGGKLRQGDQIYCLRGSLGKHAVFDLDCDAAIASSLVILRPVITDCVPYLSLYLDSDIAQTLLRRFDNGSAQPNLSSANLRRYEIPLPPLAEQHRIVAKVDELMALLDRLEATRTAAEATRDRLAAASLARLTAPDTTPEAFPAHARFVLDALPALTKRPDQIKSLRQTILNLAVRGKLVEQDPNDEPASELLKRIADDVQNYVQANGVRGAQVCKVSDKDQPFGPPLGWVWVRLASLCRVVTDGDHQPPPRSDDGIAFLTIGNVTTGKLEFAGCRRVPPEYFDSLPAYRTPVIGDLLYTVVGATFGRPILVNAGEPFCVQRHIAILKPSDQISVPYLYRVLASPFVYEQAATATTGAAQPTIALRPLRNFLIPLPPLAEQHRIVAKVDALMALCDRLEAALATSDTTKQRLLEALLHEALAEGSRNRKAA